MARPDATSNVTYGSSNPPYRNVNETSNTVVEQGKEHHYIFSVEYDSSTGSSLKIYIDGNKKGENTANLEKELVSIQPEISRWIESEIISRYYFQSGVSRHSFRFDLDVLKAKELLINLDMYNNILKL